jgi:hypothetical protein
MTWIFINFQVNDLNRSLVVATWDSDICLDRSELSALVLSVTFGHPEHAHITHSTTVRPPNIPTAKFQQMYCFNVYPKIR